LERGVLQVELAQAFVDDVDRGEGLAGADGISALFLLFLLLGLGLGLGLCGDLGDGFDRVKDPFVRLVLGRDGVQGLLVVDGVLDVVGPGVGHALALDEFLESFNFAGGADEAVLQQVPGGGAVVGVFDQALRDKVFELLAELALEARRRVLGDVEEDLHGVHVRVGRLAEGQLDGGDAERPDVGLEVVAGLLDHLGSHPEGGADEGVALRLHVGQLGSDAKVGQLNLAGLGEEDVGGLDVAVDFAFGVEIVEAEEELAADDGDLDLVEGARFQLGAVSISGTWEWEV
jgi:hypothetical protein